MSPSPRNDWCLASRQLADVHLSDGCKVGTMQPLFEENWGAKPITDDWLSSRPMQQCIGEEPGELRGSLMQTILSQAPILIEMQGEREKVQRLGSSPVGPSGPKRRGPHVGYEIVCSAWRHAAASKEAVPNSRLGMNTRQHDHEGSSKALEEFERLDSWAFREQSLSKNQVNSVELPMGQYRAKPSLELVKEGVTVRAQARRAKWLEMPGSVRTDEEMTSSIQQCIAAERRLEINDLQRRQGSAERGLIRWSTLNQVNSGNIQTGQSRAKPRPFGEWEGVTTIPQGSRTKWSEAPGPSTLRSEGDDIVSSAWEHAAAQ